VLALILAACQAEPSQPATARPVLTPEPTTTLEPSSEASEPAPSPTLKAGAVTGQFAVTIADPDGLFSTNVTIVDRTGLIEGVTGQIPDVPIDKVTQAESPDTGLIYSWILAGCSRSTEITFEQADIIGNDTDSYRLGVVQSGQQGSCLAAEIGRSVLLALTKPVKASQVHVVSGQVAFRYLGGLDAFGGRYRTEWELIDRTGLVTGLAEPAKVNQRGGGPLSEALPPDVGLQYWPGPSSCVYRVAMAFEAAGEGRYRLQTWYDYRYVGADCFDSIGRWVQILLRQQVSPAMVRIIEVIDSV
jgi:hypothetical protein